MTCLLGWTSYIFIWCKSIGVYEIKTTFRIKNVFVWHLILSVNSVNKFSELYLPHGSTVKWLYKVVETKVYYLGLVWIREFRCKRSLLSEGTDYT